MEGQLRKQRQETIYTQQQMRRQIGEGLAWSFLVGVIGGFILLLTSMFTGKVNEYNYKYVPKNYNKQ